MITKLCLYCNKEFKTKKQGKTTSITCSIVCRNRYISNKRKLYKYPKYLLDCIQCGEPVYAKSIYFDKPNRKYCDKACKQRHERTGKRIPIEIVIKTRGEKHYNWKGGKTEENKKIRTSQDYKLWRKAVFERDKYQCIIGGVEHGSKLQADHIKPFALFPQLRLELSNGRTLCIECHKKTDTYAGRSHNK